MVRSKKGNKKSNTKKKSSKKNPSVGKKSSNREYGFNSAENISFSGFGTNEPETISEQIQSTNGFGLDRCNLYTTKRGCNKDNDCYFNGVTNKCNPKCNKLNDDDCNYHSDVCELKAPGNCVGKLIQLKKPTIKSKRNSVNMYTPSNEEMVQMNNRNLGKLSTSVNFNNLPGPANEVMRSASSKLPSATKTNPSKPKPKPKPKPKTKPKPRSNNLFENITSRTKAIKSRPPVPLNLEFIEDEEPTGSSTKKKLEQQFARINNLPAPANEVMRSTSSKSTSAKKRSAKKTTSASNKSSRSRSQKAKTDVHKGIRQFKISKLKSSKIPKKATFTIYKQISKLIMEKVTTKTHAKLLKNYVDTNKPTQSNKKGNEALEEEAQFINKLMIHALFLKNKEKKITMISYTQFSQIINNILQSNEELHETFKRITRRHAVNGSNEESNNWSPLSNSN